MESIKNGFLKQAIKIDTIERAINNRAIRAASKYSKGYHAAKRLKV